MSNPKNFWVVPHGNGNWAVIQEGNPVTISIHSLKVLAVEEARRYTMAHKGELIVCRSDRTIEYRNTYGVDPFPPRG